MRFTSHDFEDLKQRACRSIVYEGGTLNLLSDTVLALVSSAENEDGLQDRIAELEEQKSALQNDLEGVMSELDELRVATLSARDILVQVCP